jgi:hypothetical protein
MDRTTDHDKGQGLRELRMATDEDDREDALHRDGNAEMDRTIAQQAHDYQPGDRIWRRINTPDGIRNYPAIYVGAADQRGRDIFIDVAAHHGGLKRLRVPITETRPRDTRTMVDDIRKGLRRRG